jgi:hypothetical protein
MFTIQQALFSKATGMIKPNAKLYRVAIAIIAIYTKEKNVVLWEVVWKLTDAYMENV